MNKYEVEKLSRQWHDGAITAQEMAEGIKGAVKAPLYIQQCGREAP